MAAPTLPSQFTTTSVSRFLEDSDLLPDEIASEFPNFTQVRREAIRASAEVLPDTGMLGDGWSMSVTQRNVAQLLPSALAAEHTAGIY